MPLTTFLRPNWREWIAGSLQRGSSSQSIVATMIAKNFEPAFANAMVAKLERELVHTRPAADTTESTNENAKTKGDLRRDASAAIWRRNPHYTYGESRISPSNVIHVSDRSIHVLARFAIPEIFIFANVLSDAECSELIQRCQLKLSRSTLTDRPGN